MAQGGACTSAREPCPQLGLSFSLSHRNPITFQVFPYVLLPFRSFYSSSSLSGPAPNQVLSQALSAGIPPPFPLWTTLFSISFEASFMTLMHDLHA